MKSIIKTIYTIVCVFNFFVLGAQNASHNANTDNISGTDCSGFGYDALTANTTGADNTALGHEALFSNSTGNKNTALGQNALYSNTGNDNAATGRKALYSNSSGFSNTAAGMQAALWVTTGDENTSMGVFSHNNVTTENFNTAIGKWAEALTGLNRQTSIGYNTIPPSNLTGNTISFGDANVTLIEVPVSITNPSDQRFKFNIREDIKGLEFIMRLRPVVYNMNTKELTKHKTLSLPKESRGRYLSDDFTKSMAIRRSGFIAQEVEQAAIESNFDFDGVIPPQGENGLYSLTMTAFIIPIVKAVQEQQVMIESLSLIIKSATIVMDVETTVLGSGLKSSNGFRMSSNRPNPFSSETVIDYYIPETNEICTLDISDLNGKKIKSYQIEVKKAASVTVNAEDLASGVYNYSISAGVVLLGNKRMIIAK
jgi:trimeric autotransporter adhesin